MVLCVKKMLVLKQYEYWFFTVLQCMLKLIHMYPFGGSEPTVVYKESLFVVEY